MKVRVLVTHERVQAWLLATLFPQSLCPLLYRAKECIDVIEAGHQAGVLNIKKVKGWASSSHLERSALAPSLLLRGSRFSYSRALPLKAYEAFEHPKTFLIGRAP